MENSGSTLVPGDQVFLDPSKCVFVGVREENHTFDFVNRICVLCPYGVYVHMIFALFLHFGFCKETNLAACVILREIHIEQVRRNSNTSTSFPAQLAQICCITPKSDLAIDQLNISQTHIYSNRPKQVEFC